MHVQFVLSSILDAGEASAIALAYDYQDVILIIDDLKAVLGIIGRNGAGKSTHYLKFLHNFISHSNQFLKPWNLL